MSGVGDRAQCDFRFVHPTNGPQTVTLGKEPDDTLRQNQFDLCRAIDTTALAVVLRRMVDGGWMGQRDAELYHLQASALRAQLVSANNAAFAHLLTEQDKHNG